MQSIIVSNGQNMPDLALQACGDVAAVFDMALINEKSITDDPEIGTSLKNPVVLNKRIATLFANEKIKPATNDLQQVIAEEGIEFWIIEEDFIIS
jgi:hypothetical protein